MINNFLKSDREIAYETLTKVVDAIETKDATAIKSLFSKKAIEESKTIDEDIELLFEFYEGNAEKFTVEDIGYPFVEKEREDNWEIEYFEQWDKVKTDKNEYVIDIQYYTENTKNPNLIGVEAIGIIKTQDGDYPFTNMNKDFYGVYIVE